MEGAETTRFRNGDSLLARLVKLDELGDVVRRDGERERFRGRCKQVYEDPIESECHQQGESAFLKFTGHRAKGRRKGRQT